MYCNVRARVCVCANPQLAAALNEQPGSGMHRSLLLCALQQALQLKVVRRECVSPCVSACACAKTT